MPASCLRRRLPYALIGIGIAGFKFCINLQNWMQSDVMEYRDTPSLSWSEDTQWPVLPFQVVVLYYFLFGH